MTERIISAALCAANGLICSLPAPARHHTIMHALFKIEARLEELEQGFLTSTGRFVGRE